MLLQRQKKLEERHAIKVEQMTAFYDGSAEGRRTLANVPTYMIMDDHDVTDDWNLNPIWVDRVNKTTFGRAILRNALASYTVFQDWGNDPVRYLNEDTARGGRSEAHARHDRQDVPARGTNATAKPATVPTDVRQRR